MLRDANGTPVRYGLGVGSADLVGVVTMHRYTISFTSAEMAAAIPQSGIGRAFALEVKLPGEKPTADQVKWLRAVRELGGFACVVTSIQEACDAVDRCRRGESQ
jgi:hypothetical protein